MKLIASISRSDKAIPPLESIDSELSDDKLESLIDQQCEFETETNYSSKELFEERNPPSTCHEFYTARMFLCHLGLLSKFRGNDKTASFLHLNYRYYCYFGG